MLLKERRVYGKIMKRTVSDVLSSLSARERLDSCALKSRRYLDGLACFKVGVTNGKLLATTETAPA